VKAAAMGSERQPSGDVREAYPMATNNDVHSEILELLLAKVESDRFPSVTQMDMIEKILRDEDVEDYAEILMDKVRNDTYPSLDLLRRLLNFA